MITIPSEWFFEEPDGLRRLTVVPALPWPSLPRRRQGAITLLCNGLGIDECHTGNEHQCKSDVVTLWVVVPERP